MVSLSFLNLEFFERRRKITPGSSNSDLKMVKSNPQAKVVCSHRKSARKKTLIDLPGVELQSAKSGRLLRMAATSTLSPGSQAVSAAISPVSKSSPSHEVLFEPRAYAKMILHAAKYPHCAVNGLLLAQVHTAALQLPTKLKG